MKALFGTDGIRGEAGQFPLDPATVTAIGFSLASHLAASGVAPKRLDRESAHRGREPGRSRVFVGGRDHNSGCCFRDAQRTSERRSGYQRVS